MGCRARRRTSDEGKNHGAAQRAAEPPVLHPESGRKRRQRAGGGLIEVWDESSESIWERSEEHTSELQSRLHLVCRLLLEKKKKRYAYSNFFMNITRVCEPLVWCQCSAYT